LIDRKVLAIPFNYDKRWIGGVYYVRNLISALNLLPNDRKPKIIILSQSDDGYNYLDEETQYPYMDWTIPGLVRGYDIGLSRKRRYINRFLHWYKNNDFVFYVVFPHPIPSVSDSTICWIPDFQDKRLPELFHNEELEQRTIQHIEYASRAKHIVFSSKSALVDFEYFYPGYNVQKHVVRFAAFNDVSNLLSFEYIQNKYSLPANYFYCPNQFWIHKNHKVVIEAVAKLANKHSKICLAFSGKEYDHRAPSYTDDLKNLVRKLGLSENVRFLGFIPRNDQLAILKNARLVVQPSLFEGWSTVIEDAKSLSQYVLASDINTHREQLVANGELFSPNDFDALSVLLEKYLEVDPPIKEFDYSTNQMKFAKDFISVVMGDL